MTDLPPLASHEVVQERLLLIFPEGFEYRNYCVRDVAASTVFAMLYTGAVDGAGRYIAPKHVYRMSDDQASLVSLAERVDYSEAAQKSGFTSRSRQWYADNSRESIRDETLRQGFIAVGAVVEDKSVATTSSKARYALAKDFARLFDPSLAGDSLSSAIEEWRGVHLSPAALARIKLVRASTSAAMTAGALVTFPNGETRRLSPGPSTIITKAVIEQFAPRFLVDPAIVWLSESGNKVVERDDLLAKSIGLNIDASRNLPDIVLADVGSHEGRTDQVLLVFVEVVATDGPVSVARREELLSLTRAARLEDERIAFVTAYMERGSAPFRKTFQTVAWNSFAWFASEPENVVALYGPSSTKLLTLMGR